MRNYYTMLYYTAFICLSSLWGQVALHANANATRLEANNLHCIDELLSNFLRHYKANEILFVWDLNYTLVYPSDPCLHTNNINLHKQTFDEIIKQISHSEADKMLSHLMANKPQKLVNDQLASFLKKYQDVNFLVCSNSLKDNIDPYLHLLESHQISMKNHYQLSNFEFNEFGEYLSGRPIYKNAVILTNKEDKGAVLQYFLKRVSSKPKLIIVVDNNAKKLQSVMSKMSTLPETTIVTVEYTEYKPTAIPTVSNEVFRDYWTEQVKTFQKSAKPIH